MDKTQIFILAFAIVILAFRIYKKYYKKAKNYPGTDNQDLKGSHFSSSSKDEDYEPYSKK
jgi:hypothetical protein